MHQSSYEHMRLCVEQYLDIDRHYRVADLGSRRVAPDHLTHRTLLKDYDVSYVGLDVVQGPNVDVVMDKPYRIPLKSNSLDVMMTNQAFEHIPFPWAAFVEITRVLRPGGLLFLIAPSRGHRHGTYDAWRYYPDSLAAFAMFARMQLLESYVDMPPRIENSRRIDYSRIDTTHSYWGDAVGVFRKPQRPSKWARVAGEVVVRWANRAAELGELPRPDVPRRRRVKRPRVHRPRVEHGAHDTATG